MAAGRGFIHARILMALAMLALVGAPAPARAAETMPALHAPALHPLAHGALADIIAPAVLVLEDGTTSTLDMVRVPAAMAAQVQAWIREHSAAAGITLSSELPAATPDRHGRIPAQAATGDLWLQAALVAQGLAWVDVPRTDSPLHARLLALENTARDKARGLWADPALGLHTPETLGDIRNRFAVISARALDVSTKKDVTYINYGRDWKTDLTLRLTRDAARNFPRDFAQRLHNAPVRVRGWVYERNGPMIDLTHPAQVEFLPVTESTP